MADQVRVYVDARKRADAAFATLHQMHEVITSVAETLRREPENFGFSGTARGLPSGVSELVNGSDWPTVTGLQDILLQCHRAAADVETAWASVPFDERSSLQPPGNPWRPVTEAIRRLS